MLDFLYTYILYVYNDIIWQWKLFFFVHLLFNNSLLNFLLTFHLTGTDSIFSPE
jgi:hypothetical protein